MSDFGTVALICSLALSLYGVVVPHFGVRSNNWNLVRSVQHASILSFLMISVASAVLMEALINSDFSIEYVWGHSSRDMPLFYKITSFCSPSIFRMVDTSRPSSALQYLPIAPLPIHVNLF